MIREIEIDSSCDGLKSYEYPCENPKAIVILIHGAGEHFQIYEGAADRFRKYGIDLMGMDLRGHGNSPGVRGHCAPREAVLKDIDCLITYAENEYPKVPVVLYGFSLGGNIVLDYRARGNLNSEIDKYVVVSPWIKLVKGIPKPLVKMLKGMSKRVPRMCLNPGFDTDDDPLLINRISLETTIDGLEIGEAVYKGTWPSFGQGHETPMLLLHGDKDRMCSVEGSRAVSRHDKNCKYIELEGIYHDAHNGGDEITDLIAEWITEV